VLGKREIAALLKWRNKVKVALKKPGKPAS